MKRINEYTLSNGLKVFTSKNPSLNSLTIQLRGRAGSNFEKLNHAGSAHMVEHCLLQSNSKEVNSINNTGGYLIAVTSKDDVLYMTKTLGGYLETTFKLLPNLFDFGRVTEKVLIKQKSIVKNEVARFNNNLEKLLLRYSYRSLYSKQRISKLNTGSEQDVERLSLRDLYFFHKEFYRPHNFVLSVCGNFDEKELSDSLSELDSTDNGQKKSGKRSQYSLRKGSKRVVNFYQKPTNNLSLCSVDFYSDPITSKNSLKNDLISKMVDQKLNEMIKNRLGLVYKIRCSNFSSSGFGKFTIFFICANKNLNNVVRKIINLLVSLTLNNKAVEPKDLQIAKSKLITNLSFNLEKTSYCAEYLSFRNLHYAYYTDPENEISEIENVSIHELTKQMKLLFNNKYKITVFTDNPLSQSGGLEF